jgi:tRNA wybutosine-synthesizing protein 5
MPRVDQLPRLDGMDDLGGYLSRQMPFIVSGVADWPAADLWDERYLRRVLGNKVVRASHSVDHRHPDLSLAPKAPPTLQIAFGDYLSLIWSGAAEAQRFFVIGDNLAIFDRFSTTAGPAHVLLDDIVIPQWISRERLESIGFWISARGSASRLHYDANGCHNLNVQLSGAKQVVMCSPDYCHLLYPYSRFSAHTSFGQFSQVDVFDPDTVQFPRFDEAMLWTGNLDKGDALFIPAFWYHAFSHEGAVNLNVNFWWSPDRQILNGVTVREAIAAALAYDVLPDPPSKGIAAKLAAIDEKTAAFVGRLETAVLNPRIPGRSDRR